MTEKRYAVLIISKEPIDLGDVAKNPSFDHMVQVELTLAPNGRGGFFIDQAVPELCMSESGTKFYGNGKSVSVAITDWLKALVSSLDYWPFYRGRQNPERNKEGK